MISWIATAAPVLVFEIIYNEINEKPITNVFVAPRRTRNPFWFVLTRVFPIIAACPLPKPGRKLQRGDAINAPARGLKSFVEGFVICWGGIWNLFFMLRTNIELPNKPVNKGNKAWFNELKFNTHSPKKPESKKTSKAVDFLFSKEMRRIDMIIKK